MISSRDKKSEFLTSYFKNRKGFVLIRNPREIEKISTIYKNHKPYEENNWLIASVSTICAEVVLTIVLQYD